MQLSVEQFNEQIEEGEEVLYFPRGGLLPLSMAVVPAKVTGRAYETIRKKVNVEIEFDGYKKIVDIFSIETCSAEQLDEIIAILDVRTGD